MEEKEKKKGMSNVPQDYKKRVSLRERRIQGGMSAENRRMLLIFAGMTATVAVTLGSVVGLHIPAVPACVIVLIEVALVLCLYDVPIWVHGITMIGQLVAGWLCSNFPFMVLCVMLYLMGILIFRLIRR